ncbi:MAG: stage IV sporulation protein A [Clostridia bacterium]|nr:stage IV sporulation protein A [Clostridia bacterium]
MQNYDIYKDIEKRTNGDLYIGVVGPVRTGKSTFLAHFMQNAVIPNIVSKSKKQEALDSLPQSASGKTVTTVEPKFLPGDSTLIKLGGKIKARVKLIDCVGYMVEGALGASEEGKPRMVKTPWSDQLIPFEKAGEIGTRKVIEEHSTVGVVVTTDGSFTGIERENYIPAEERAIKELKEIGKPFVIILNVKDAREESAQALGEKLAKKHGVSVLVKNLLALSERDVEEIMECMLMEFPVRSLGVDIPDWMRLEDADNRLIAPLLQAVRVNLSKLKKMSDYKILCEELEKLDFALGASSELDLGEGSMRINFVPTDGAYYSALSQACGENIEERLALMRFVKTSAVAKQEYEKLKGALYEAEQTGYGIVAPSEEEIILSEPEMVKTGSSYGVKIKATAPSLHIVKVEIGAEVSSVVGKEKQCSDYVEGLKQKYQENPQGIMQVDLFGRPIYSFVSEEIFDKAGGMKAPFREKLRKTVAKLVNEKKNALICVTI